jgi:hypothetical protein
VPIRPVLGSVDTSLRSGCPIVEMLCHVAGKLSDGTVLDGDPDLFGGLLTTIGEALWGVVYDATKATTAPFSARNGRLTRQTGS